VLNRLLTTRVSIQAPDFHEDQYLLYEKYISARHADGDMYPPSREQYRSFLIQGGATTRFVEFSVNDALIGIAVMDELEDGLSAIYTFFDPELEYLSPGTMAVLWQIEAARLRRLRYLYLGYYIRECQKMRYKTLFQPYEALIGETWMDQQDMRKILSRKPDSRAG
jgi:arginine-tRNA-protein transferase